MKPDLVRTDREYLSVAYSALSIIIAVEPECLLAPACLG